MTPACKEHAMRISEDGQNQSPSWATRIDREIQIRRCNMKKIGLVGGTGPESTAMYYKIRKVGLLGTAFTMEQEYMKQDLKAAGIQVFVPNEQERELVARRIFKELENGIVKKETLREFQTIMNRMKEQDGIEGVILGCTELPLLLNSETCPVHCLDAVQIHIRKLIELAME